MHFLNKFDIVPRMAHKIPVFFLILFSSCGMIFLNAVHAAKSTEDADSAVHPKKRVESLQEMEVFSHLKKCNRRPHWDQQEEGYGASAFIDLNQENLKDFSMGQDLNYEMLCLRIFLDMKKLTDSSLDSPVYKGNFVVAYDYIIPTQKEKTIEYRWHAPYDTYFKIIAAEGIAGTVEYNSGETAEDNQFNTWQGNWETPDVNFAAIFESSKPLGSHRVFLINPPETFPDSAVILNINKVEKEDTVDGEPAYKGHGEIWFKMFRLFHHKEDVCYTKGNYISNAYLLPPVPRRKCWFLDIGPYSCLPRGIRTIESFDLRSDLPCYKKLGEFEDLDIRKAFNLSPEENYL